MHFLLWTLKLYIGAHYPSIVRSQLVVVTQPLKSRFNRNTSLMKLTKLKKWIMLEEKWTLSLKQILYIFSYFHTFSRVAVPFHRKIYHLHNILLSGFNWHKIVNCKVKSTVTTDCKDILATSIFYFWMINIVSPSGIQTWDLMHAT